MNEPKPSRLPLFVAAGGAAAALTLDVALGTPGAPSDMASFVGRFHPLVVHLPIGVILLLATLEGLSVVFPRVRAKVDPSLGVVLMVALGTAVMAFAMGLLLAHGGGYPAKLLKLHKLLTLATVIGAAAALVAWTLVNERGVTRLAYRGALGATVGLLSIGAHFGGSMTHGDNYLVQYAPSFLKGMLGTEKAKEDAPPPAESAKPDDARVFADAVMPVLKAKCVECHGAEKSKAGLRLDSLEAAMKGGEDGPVIVAGHSEKSSLVGRVRKPASDDEHMPPEDKPQMTAEELELLAFWIDRGASADLKVRDVLVPDGARGLLQKTGANATPAPAQQHTDAAPPQRPTSDVASTTTADAHAVPAPETGGAAWSQLIAPMLADKCGRCHGAEKQKGKLRTDSLAALLSGGKGGPAVVPNDSARGTLLTRVHLPLTDDKHMPPSDEAQLTASDTQLLAFWIGHGASADLRTTDLPQALRHVSATRAKTAPTSTKTGEPPAAATTITATTTTPDPQPTSKPPATVTQPVKLYADVVAPIFKARCGECHAGEFAAGDFVVGDHAALLAKSRVVPRDPKTSALFGQMTSPVVSDDHMPPKKRAQPAQDEVDAVRLWIERGAGEDVVVDASEISPKLLGAIASPKPTQPEPASAVTTPNAAVASLAVPPRAGGCGSCAVAPSEGSALAGLSLPGLLGLALARRRRRHS